MVPSSPLTPLSMRTSPQRDVVIRRSSAAWIAGWPNPERCSSWPWSEPVLSIPVNAGIPALAASTHPRLLAYAEAHFARYGKHRAVGGAPGSAR
jgi:hypothetical protein